MADRVRTQGGLRVDIVVVGAGLAGLYALHSFRKLRKSVLVVETGSDVGGTWYWNRYPGARCDVESHDYSYSFSPELEQEWEWTERFPTQPEMLEYIRHVADRFDLRRDIRFDARVVSATYHESETSWSVGLDDGTTVECSFCVLATGCLSSPKEPDIDGIETFKGSIIRTSDWPKDEPDLSQKRVAVIGTGSSGIQCIPVLAERVAHLDVLQRTPNFSVPARNAPLDPERTREFKATYRDYRARARDSYAGVVIVGTGLQALSVDPQDRESEYRARWDRGGVQFLGAYTDLRTDLVANETAADFVRDRIREIVADQEVAEKLLPRGYPIGTRRLCVDSGYYQTFNRENVRLVDLRETPIERVVADGIRTSAGKLDVDVVVLATGFDAFTGALSKLDIRGRNDVSLRDKWADGPRTYLGLAVAGFPNLFTVTGPGSPSVLANMIRAIEQHVDWIADCIAWLDEQGVQSIEATADAEHEWMEHVVGVADTTIYPSTDSWYVGSNIPGKPRVFIAYLGGLDVYSARCDEVAASGYAGFVTGTRAPLTQPSVTTATQ